MPVDSKTRWQAGIEYLRSIESHAVSHSRRTLLDHLIGTHNLLQSWGAAENVCLAGLFHSVYGTEGFRATLAGIPDRTIITNIIGAEAESLAWLFGIKTNKSFWDQVGLLNIPDAPTFALTNRLTGERVPCTREDLLRVVDMVLANAFDQADHIPEHFTEQKSAALRQLLPFALPEATVAFTKRFEKQRPAGVPVKSRPATLPGNG